MTEHRRSPARVALIAVGFLTAVIVVIAGFYLALFGYLGMTLGEVPVPYGARYIGMLVVGVLAMAGGGFVIVRRLVKLISGRRTAEPHRSRQ